MGQFTLLLQHMNYIYILNIIYTLKDKNIIKAKFSLVIKIQVLHQKSFVKKRSLEEWILLPINKHFIISMLVVFGSLFHIKLTSKYYLLIII